MKQERTIRVRWVALDEKDLAKVAARLAGLVEVARKNAEDEAERQAKTLTSEAEEYFWEASRSMTLAHLRPSYSVATVDGSFSDSDWDTLWSRVSHADVRSITLTGKGPNTEVRAEFDLTGGRSVTSSNRILITSNDAEEFNREIGFFTDLLTRARRPVRELLASEVSGLILWIGVAVVAGGAIGRRLSVSSSPASSILAGGLLGLIPGLMLYLWVAPRLLPVMEVPGAGPNQELRAHATLIILAFLGSALLAVVIAILDLPLGAA